MLDVDPLLLDAITGSHRRAIRADVWRDGRLVLQGLTPTEWTVTADGSSKIERSFELVVGGDDPALNPSRLGAPLAPFGSEVWLTERIETGRSGIDVPLIVGVITAPQPEATYKRYGSKVVTTGVTVTVTGKDRALKLDDARFEQKEFTRSNTLHGEVDRLCQWITPTGAHEVPQRSLAQAVYESDDRLDALDKVAQQAGARVSIDVYGQAVLRPRLSTGDTWWIPEDSSLLAVRPRLTRDGVYNAIVVRGTDPADQSPIVRVAYETSGELRYGGPFGRKPKFYESSFITSAGQAQSTASSMLMDQIRARQSLVEIETIGNPALEPLDWVRWQHGGEWFAGVVKRIQWQHTGRMIVEAWLTLGDQERLA